MLNKYSSLGAYVESRQEYICVRVAVWYKNTPTHRALDIFSKEIDNRWPTSSSVLVVNDEKLIILDFIFLVH